MRTLIIHPDDRSTDFLRPIYQHIEGATVLTKNISNHQLKREIQSHDQILMMGHGTPSGLMNVANLGKGTFTIDRSHVELLRNKHCIFIWCNADKFVERYQLKGLYTGMFISEVNEAMFCNVVANQDEVDESNSTFSDILGNVLKEAPADYSRIFRHVKDTYGELAAVNEIASYNNQRWYFTPEKSKRTLYSSAMDYVKKIFALLIAIMCLTSCASHKRAYEVSFHKTVDVIYNIDYIDYIFVHPKDTMCWDWYKETDMYEEFAPQSDSITIKYWGTMKEFRRMERVGF
jgi:hypothetical protein